MRTNIQTPAQLEKELNRKVIGQGQYLHDLSLCIWLHSQRRENFKRTGNRNCGPKYNMLVIGQSGMGKTSAIHAAADLLDLPVVVEDASELRGTGWKGKQLTDISRDIVSCTAQRHGTMGDAEFAIVVLDEIDKIFGGEVSDVTFSPINNLLKYIEGMESSWNEEGNVRRRLHTENLLFICIGAFDGLDEIIEGRLQPKNIGFAAEAQGEEIPEENVLQEVIPEDLISYGMSEQFLGRLPLITVMNDLGREDYEDILVQSEISPVSQLNQLMRETQGVSISISENAAMAIAENAVHSSTGARALQGEVIRLFKDKLYELPDHPECNEYCLDYDDHFFVREISGTRVVQTSDANQPMRLSREERGCLRQVRLEEIPQTAAAIRSYAEQMFEPFESKGYSERNGEGLANLYDYMTLKQAQYLAAAAITHLLIDVDYGDGSNNNMFSLLLCIRRVTAKTPRISNHPLERVKKEFCARFASESDERIAQLRKLAWRVVRKYALLIYKIDFEAEEDDEFVS